MLGVMNLGGRVELRELPKPEPGVGQALVKMQSSGLCGSDVPQVSI